MRIGGQAVMEGVMLKSEKKIATAVRVLNKKKIKVKVKKSKKTPKIFKIPFIRGIYVLIDSMITGLDALIWSSNQNLEKEEKIKKGELFLTLFLSLIFGMVIFLGFPYLIARILTENNVLFSVIEGFMRIGLFMGYLVIIGLSKDVKRLFQYHGAEHKIIHCYEAGKKVTVKNAKKYSTLHGRCGTAFIIIVLLLSIVVFSFFGTGWTRLLWKLLFIPLIAGVSYEILRLGERFKGSKTIKAIIWPGLMLQKLTTREPDNKQLEVGIKAWERVVK